MSKKAPPKIIRKLHQIDAEGKIIGRLASHIAILLQGKHKVYYSPYIDCGDYVNVKNVSKMKWSGEKERIKKYWHYTGYPGGSRISSLKFEMEKNPARVLRRAVARMLPKNRLQANRLKRLSIKGEKKIFKLW